MLSPRRPQHSVPTSIGLAILLSIASVPAFAFGTAAIRVTPSCAAPDSSVLVETNGWPKLHNDSEHVVHQIFLDFGTPHQVQLYPLPGEDGRAPYTTFWADTVTVPGSASPGTHTILVKQIEYRPPPFSQLIETACVRVVFEVALDSGDPWASVHDTTYEHRPVNNNKAIVFIFDPSAVCDVTSCDALRLIQVQQDLGESGGSYFVASIDSMYLDYKQRDSTRTLGGFMVDAWGAVPGVTLSGTEVPAAAERDPYMNGDDAPWDEQPGATVGFRNADGSNISRFRDGPMSSDIAIARIGAEAIVRRFETCAYCSAGAQAGQFLGSVLWRWRRALGGVATIDSIVTSRRQPTPMFKEALQRWGTVRSRPVRSPAPPTEGGFQCY